MKKTDTTKVMTIAGEEPPTGATDWEAVDRLSEAELLAAAEADPDAQPFAMPQLAAMRRVSRVKVLRQRLGLTQAEFSDAYGVPIGTLRDWEQRRSTPDAPARALLRAIDRDPETMRRLLSNVA